MTGEAFGACTAKLHREEMQGRDVASAASLFILIWIWGILLLKLYLHLHFNVV